MRASSCLVLTLSGLLACGPSPDEGEERSPRTTPGATTTGDDDESLDEPTGWPNDDDDDLDGPSPNEPPASAPGQEDEGEARAPDLDEEVDDGAADETGSGADEELEEPDDDDVPPSDAPLSCQQLAFCCPELGILSGSCETTVEENDGSGCAARLAVAELAGYCEGFGDIDPALWPPPAYPEQPAVSGEVNVSSTIVIDEPGVYDFENIMHVWTGAGSCNQTENQPPILHIAVSDVTVKNFGYRNAPDGIHIGSEVGAGQGHSSGSNVSNVVLDGVFGYACEDALTTQYNTHDITIRNAWFHGNPNETYRDKTLQLNFADGVLIEDSAFVSGERCIRFKGGADITVRNTLFHGCRYPVKGDTVDLIGEIPDDPSVFRSEGNTFVDYNRAFHGVGDVHFTVLDDVRYGPDDDEMEQGATITYE